VSTQAEVDATNVVNQQLADLLVWLEHGYMERAMEVIENKDNDPEVALACSTELLRKARVVRRSCRYIDRWRIDGRWLRMGRYFVALVNHLEKSRTGYHVDPGGVLTTRGGWVAGV
jgi:hypothetical protein